MKIKIKSSWKNIKLMKAMRIPHDEAVAFAASTIVVCDSPKSIPSQKEIPSYWTWSMGGYENRAFTIVPSSHSAVTEPRQN